MACILSRIMDLSFPETPSLVFSQYFSFAVWVLSQNEKLSVYSFDAFSRVPKRSMISSAALIVPYLF
ncbi:MAG: hypothetical protein KKH98_00205 [Spirochaetes bacterium]|nr:hypothetical protein [Spirochaetota bacterium]